MLLEVGAEKQTRPAFPQGKKQVFLNLWFSKPMLCNPWLSRIDGDLENDEENWESHRKGGWVLLKRIERKTKKGWKPRHSGVQKTDSPQKRV